MGPRAPVVPGARRSRRAALTARAEGRRRRGWRGGPRASPEAASAQVSARAAAAAAPSPHLPHSPHPPAASAEARSRSSSPPPPPHKTRPLRSQQPPFRPAREQRLHPRSLPARPEHGPRPQRIPAPARGLPPAATPTAPGPPACLSVRPALTPSPPGGARPAARRRPLKPSAGAALPWQRGPPPPRPRGAASLRRLPPSCVVGARPRRPPRPSPRRGPGRPRESAGAGRQSRRVPRAPFSPLAVDSRLDGDGAAVGPEGRARRSASCGRRGPAGAGAAPRLGCALRANGGGGRESGLVSGEGPGRRRCLAPEVLGVGTAGELLPPVRGTSGELKRPRPACPCASASFCRHRVRKSLVLLENPQRLKLGR